MKAAVHGVDTVHLVTNMYSGVDQEAPQGIRVVDAAVAAGVDHIVLSSVAGANANSGVPHFDAKFEVEQHLQNGAKNWSIVAPVFFMENLTFAWNLPALQNGKFRQAIGDSTYLQMISSTDIGAFIAHVIDQGEAFYGERIEIAGDELTGPQAAEILSETSGRAIAFEQQPREEVAAMGEDVALMYDWFESIGYSANIESLRSKYKDIDWTTFADWAGKQDWKALLQPTPTTV
ncbi:NAD(P)H-binding protein [SAR202 cluster bacterium JH702]|uniref:NAD(P)H-binding protein n=1 Tax=Candidatus Lucifugimonas marina TaxID=3038979 RepID=A0ABD4XQ26_9CHLR|nr:NAD(P)H-binding protein [SAR202 cluster bacterium JH702]